MRLLCLVLLLFSSALMAAEKTFWIDVRTAEEYSTGHLEEAVNIPYDKIATEIAKITTDKSATIKVYCKVGGRAGIAKKILEKMGYTNVTNAGGYDDLKKAGNK